MHGRAKTFMVFMALFVALAPAAEASISLMPDVCLPMQMSKSAPASCCGAGCECSIETQKTPQAADLPTLTEFFKAASAPLSASGPVMTAPPDAEKGLEAQESPPQKNPLYQEYSEYRL